METTKPEWGAKAEITHQGKKVAISITQGEILDNGWITFSIHSDDDTFLKVFGQNPIPLLIKPKGEFKPEYDFFQNTPEQVELVKEMWNIIQNRYF